VDNERYPSYVNFHKEPLVRTKLSADGRTILVVACNPHGGWKNMVLTSWATSRLSRGSRLHGVESAYGSDARMELCRMCKPDLLFTLECAVIINSSSSLRFEACRRRC
jgi:hypothetical protein